MGVAVADSDMANGHDITVRSANPLSATAGPITLAVALFTKFYFFSTASFFFLTSKNTPAAMASTMSRYAT